MDEQSPSRPLPRILVLARQPMARAALRGMLLESSAGILAGQAASPDETAVLARDLGADLVLAAWEHGEVEDLAELAEGLAAERVPLVLLGDEPSAGELAVLLRAGVHGFLLQEVAPDSLELVLRTVADGRVVLDPSLARLVASTAPLASLGGEEPLTEREQQVLQLLATGLPNKTIASRLHISEHTVKFHVASIMAKLQAASRTEAVTRAARQGLLAL